MFRYRVETRPQGGGDPGTDLGHEMMSHLSWDSSRGAGGGRWLGKLVLEYLFTQNSRSVESLMNTHCLGWWWTLTTFGIISGNNILLHFHPVRRENTFSSVLTNCDRITEGSLWSKSNLGSGLWIIYIQCSINYPDWCLINSQHFIKSEDFATQCFSTSTSMKYFLKHVFVRGHEQVSINNTNKQTCSSCWTLLTSRMVFGWFWAWRQEWDVGAGEAFPGAAGKRLHRQNFFRSHRRWIWALMFRVLADTRNVQENTRCVCYSSFIHVCPDAPHSAVPHDKTCHGSVIFNQLFSGNSMANTCI